MSKLLCNCTASITQVLADATENESCEAILFSLSWEAYETVRKYYDGGVKEHICTLAIEDQITFLLIILEAEES